MKIQSLAIVSEFMLLELYVSKNSEIILHGNGFIDNKFNAQHIIITIEDLKTIFNRATKTDIQLLSHEIDKVISKSRNHEVLIDYNKIICHGFSKMNSNLIMVVEKSENDIKLLYAKSIINRIECKSQDELLNQEFKRYILNFYNILEQYDIKEGSTEISNSNGESVAYDPSYLAIEFSIFLQDYMVTNSVDDINLATL